jgi:O-antigen ligase
MDAEEVRLEHGHNLLLTTWMELGIVGLVGIVVLIRSLAPLLATRPGLRVLRPVVASAVVGWLVDGLFETSTLSVFFWALIGLGLAIAYWDGEELEPGAEGTACVSP